MSKLPTATAMWANHAAYSRATGQPY